MLKVCQRPELIQQLQHSLEFATDEQVNNDILLKYSLWDYLTPCDADNENILNACIARWRDEANQLYRTTLLQYDPLGNVNLHEDIADERRPDLTDTYSPEDTTTTAEAGYDVPRTMYDAVKTTRGGKDVTTRKGKENYERNKDLTGSDGRYTQQQLVEMQRKLVLDCLSWYVSKFAQCFNVSMSISDYECCEPVPDMCCELVPQISPVDKKLNDIDNQLGVIQQSLTDCCTSMAEDIDELKKSVADSKELLAAAISDKGVETASDDSFQTMADNIAAIPTGSEWILYQSWDFVSDLTDSLTGSTFGNTWAATVSNGVTFSNEAGSKISSPSIYVQPRPGIAFEVDFGEIPFNRATTNHIYNSFVVRTAGPANGAVCVCAANDPDPDHDPYAVYFITSYTNNGSRTWTKICDSTQDLVGKTLRIEMINRETFIGSEFKLYLDGEYITTTVTDVGANYLWGSAGAYGFGASSSYYSWLWTLKGFRVYYRTE